MKPSERGRLMPKETEPAEPRETEQPAGLSPRELVVAQLVARGYLTSEIARKLSLSIDTVQGAVARCYMKLRLHNRAQLTRWVLERQKDTEPPPAA